MKRVLLLGLLVCACGGGEREDQPGDGAKTQPPKAVAKLSADGALVVPESAVDATVAAVASEEKSEVFTRYRLDLAFAGAGGDLRFSLSSNGNPMAAAAFPRYDHDGTAMGRSLGDVTWKINDVEWVSGPLPDEDPSKVVVGTFEWKAGGKVAGNLDLKLVKKGDAAQTVQVTGAFDVAVTQGP